MEKLSYARFAREKMLIRDKFGVVGTSVGLIETDYRRASRESYQWQCDLFGAGEIRSKNVAGTFESILAMLLPLVTPVPNRELFVETNSGHCAFFNNFRRGPDVVSEMVVLAKRLSVRSIRATCMPPQISLISDPRTSRQFAGNIMEVFDESGSSIRSISAVNDGGKWGFDQSGTPFEFEITSKYESKKIRDRFSQDMLFSYLDNLSCNAFEFESYPARCEGVLVERVNSKIVFESYDLLGESISGLS